MHARLARLCLIVLAAALGVAGCAPAPQTPTPAPPKPAATSAPSAPASPKPAPTAVAAPKPPATAAPQAKPAEKPAVDEKALADFYRGKTLRIIVGFPPGGGYDILSRLLARYMGQYIPGNPTIIVENMAGAGSLVAANHVYNVAAQDGTIIGNVNGEATAMEQLFGTQAVQFDVTRMQYLGSPYGNTYVLYARKASGITKLEDVLGPRAKQIVVGGSTAGNITLQGPLLLRETLGMNTKVVPGYGGTAAYLTAMEQGELDGFVNPWETTKGIVEEKMRSGDVLILGQFSETPHKDLQQVPVFLKLVSREEDRRLLRLRTILPGQFAIQYFVGPGVSPDRAQMLESAFARTLADKEFVAAALKVQMEPAPVSGVQVRKLVVDFMGMPPDIKARLQAMQ